MRSLARVTFRQLGHTQARFSQGCRVSSTGSLGMRPDIEWSLESYGATRNPHGIMAEAEQAGSGNNQASPRMNRPEAETW